MEEIPEIVLIHNDQNYPDETKHDETEYKKKFWTYDETLSLISIVQARYDELYHSRERKHVWENISMDLESMNIFATANVCSKKWQNMLRSYRSCIENRNKNGRGPMRFQFFEKIDEVIGDKPHIDSKHALNVININAVNSNISGCSPNIESPSSISAHNSEHETSNASSLNTYEPLKRVRTVSISSEEQNEDNSPPVTHKGNKRKNVQIDYINYKKQFYEGKEAEWRKRREDKKERENLKLELFKKKMELEERKIQILEKLVNQRNKIISNIASPSISRCERETSSLNTCESLKRRRTGSISSEEQNEDNSPPIKPKGRTEQEKVQIDYINYKKQFFESKEAEWRKRREDKKIEENLKLELFKKKMELEEKKIRILEVMANQRNKDV